jgi:hypothetical protein
MKRPTALLGGCIRLLVILIIVFLAGYGQTKLVRPKDITEQSPAIQGLLSQLSPNLAYEVNKLPDFQQSAGERQTQALKRFVYLTNNITESEKSNLSFLLEVGIPESRKYCTPLQAIFWLLEKKDYQPGSSPLGYPLIDLLYKAWDYTEKERWKDYETVTDRLNSHALVNYYSRSRFIYDLRGENWTPGGPTYNPRLLFSQNAGHCRDVTAFTVYCLRKGGYKSEEYRVIPGIMRGDYHSATVFEIHGKKYIMDNGRRDKLLRKDFIPFEEYKPHDLSKNFRGKLCQSCALPMDPEDFGTNSDGSKNDEFCNLCCMDGKFMDPNITMNQMIKESLIRLSRKLKVPESQAEEAADLFVPKLKRWK